MAIKGDEDMMGAFDAACSSAVWSGLTRFEPNARHLERNRIVTASRRDPASNAIDLLRTRILNTMDDRGWRHLGVTSATRDCGKTFISANLAFSMARQTHRRSILFDMDLRNPSVARILGIPDAGSILPAYEGESSLDSHMLRVADNFAVVPNTTATDTAAEVLMSTTTANVLARAFERLRPDTVIYDLPPALICDDVLAFKHRLDALLLVVHGGHTTPKQVRDFEAMFENEIPILATVLNEAEDAHLSHYIGSGPHSR